jgi:prepilin-type N-terminal cleavage/methylation domain-containing protein
MSNLRKSLSAARNNDEGFTLVELLIVIVVLGVLASIVVFGVATFRTDAQTAACKADMKQLSTAADAFNAKTGAYPAGGTSAANIKILTDAGYLKAAPTSTATLADAGVVAGCPA